MLARILLNTCTHNGSSRREHGHIHVVLIVGSIQQVVQDNANIRHDLQGRETLQETCDKLQ